MRVLIAYPGHKFSTWDVAVGYESALRELGHVVQSFDYHTRLAFYANALTYFQVENKDFERSDGDYSVLASEAIAIEAIDFVPDVVLVITGTALHRRGYDLLNRLSIPIAVLLTESPYADEVHAPILEKGHVAVAFTNEKNSVATLSEDAGVPVHYLPHSFDPERHKREKVHKVYDSNVFFFGTLWEERKRLFEGLKGKRGYRVDGVDPALDGVSDTPPIPNSEMAKWYNGTKIAINHHRTFCGVANDGSERHIKMPAFSLNPRAFEIAACGTFQLCDDSRGELRAIFADTVATYNTPLDLTWQLDYYLSKDKERRDMAGEAHLIVQECTFANRAKTIIEPILMETIK